MSAWGSWGALTDTDMLILPLHLLVFRLMGIPIQPALSTLRAVLRHQFAAPPPIHDTLARPSYLRSLSRSSLPPDVIPAPIERRSSMRRLLGPEERRRGRKEWKWRLAKRVGSLTLLIALPALTWYAAVPLTSMTDITAIYNVFAFWAYLLSIVLLKEEATRLKLGAVLLAVTGVFVIAYGDSLLAPGDPVMELNQGSSRLLGNLLALAGSIFYAFYEVWYKMHVSLPEPRSTDDVEQDPGETESLLSSRASSINGDAESTLHGTSSSTSTIRPPLPYPPSAKGADGSSVSSFLPPPVDPSNTTFLLHSNVITFLIGLSTFCFLWIPIPILHLVGWEHFELPPASTIPAIVGIVLSGVIFNAGFMVLLSLWGPVIAVSCGPACVSR